jgi:hypothetical protein
MRMVERNRIVTDRLCPLAFAFAGLAVAACTVTTGAGSDARDGSVSAIGQEAGMGDDSSLPPNASDAGNMSDDGSSPGTAVGSADSSSRTSGDAATVATPPPDYVWYVLDETQGSTAHDSSPNHFDITNLTGVTWSEGANFNGSGCGSTTVTPAYRSLPLTVSAWLTPNMRTDAPNTHAIQPYPQNALSDDIPGVGGYSLGLNVWSKGSALAFQGLSDCSVGLCAARSTQNTQDADGGPSCTSAANCNQGFVAGNQYFVAVSIGPVGDGSAQAPASVYVNGDIFDQTTAGVESARSAPPIYLGCVNGDTGYGTARLFDGRIRDVRVYKRQLAADEVQQMYLNGPTLQAPAQADAGSSDAASD